MHRLPVAVLIVPLLLLSACAASKPSKAQLTEPSKALLTDAQLEEVAGNPPDNESNIPVQYLATRDSPVFQNNDGRINVVPMAPSGSSGSMSFWSREPVPLGLR